MTLPFDYARCMTPCALAAQCRRTEPGREWMQPMSVYPGGPECCGLIERGDNHSAAFGKMVAPLFGGC